MNMKICQNTKRYYAYVRKSSESREKQALSISAQKRQIRAQFPDLNITFIEEERSAFEYGNRPLFKEMLEALENSNYEGLIAWHPDRLSRNEHDAAEITYRVRTGKLGELRFVSYTFDNSPEGIMMLQFALCQSQYESAKKGKDVERGMREKAETGYPPGQAPLGYKNAENPCPMGPHERRITVPDSDFDMYRRMFDLMLTGKYTPPQIQKIVNEEWQFRTKNGKKISRSKMYGLLTNPFYCGQFEYPLSSGEWYTGKYTPMITYAEHETILQMLDKGYTTRPQNRTFPYRGPVKCGECGAAITAQQTIKRQKNGVVRYYHYYHCTGRKVKDCPQSKIHITQKQLDEQVSEKIKEMEIPPEFHKYALKWVERENKKEQKNRNKVLEHQRKEYDDCIRLLDRLTDMRAREEIDADDFARRKNELSEKKRILERQLQETDERIDRWHQITQDVFTFLENARLKLLEADDKKKTEILQAMGITFTLSGKILNIELHDAFKPMPECAAAVSSIHKELKPHKTPATEEQMEKMYENSSRVLPG